MKERLPPEVGEQIGPYYVYALIDPRDGYDREIFYVGKGTGGRLLSHGLEALLEYEAGTEPDKIARIKAIRAGGDEPQIDVIHHGLEEPEALLVEAAVIDSFEVENLTNKVRGHGTDKGRASLDDLISLYGAPPVGESAPPALLIVLGDWTESEEELQPGHFRLGHGYKSRLTPTQIADATRAWWKVSPDVVEQKGIRHAVAVHAGVTRAVMEIGEWIGPREDGRWAFMSQPLTEGHIYDEWIGTRGRKIDFDTPPQNPIRYWPFMNN